MDVLVECCCAHPPTSLFMPIFCLFALHENSASASRTSFLDSPVRKSCLRTLSQPRALAGAANDQQQQQQFGIVQHRLHHACCLSHLFHNSTRSSAGADVTVGDRRL